mmetsp:Transcript_94809/g.156567  ORF Transcript_94809/g.156567 Transcript_94809/m.156567 type:complete len:201 (+) Transcript_94809:191-793(+)
MPARNNLGCRVDRSDLCCKLVPPSRIHEVALVQQTNVAECQLLAQQPADVLAVVEGLEICSITDADHSIQTVGGLHVGVSEEGLRHRCHLRQARALDDEAVKLGQGLLSCRCSAHCPLGEPSESIHKITAHTTAQAPIGHHHHLRVASLHRHEMVVYGDAAKLVLHDRNPLAMLQAFEYKIEEGRFPGSQESSEDGSLHS